MGGAGDCVPWRVVVAVMVWLCEVSAALIAAMGAAARELSHVFIVGPCGCSTNACRYEVQLAMEQRSLIKVVEQGNPRLFINTPPHPA